MGTLRPIKYVALIDGEHYPPVVEAALADLTAAGNEVCGAVFAGGTEKIKGGIPGHIGRVPVKAGDPVAALQEAVAEWGPDAVVDLSDEPVLDYRRRLLLASIALHAGVAYQGADFRFEPPPRPVLCIKPSIAVIATGKRAGKTAVAGFAARTLKSAGFSPVVVAMGRGGPPEPEVLRGDEVRLDADDLIALADSGRHAASDYVEDALLARVPTVGCRRCGGGLAGGVDVTNFHRGVELANSLPGDILILEGSGAAIPPVHADATVLVVPAAVDPEYLRGYLGPYRLLLADLVVVTMAEDPFGSPSQIDSIVSQFRDSIPSGTAPNHVGQDPDGQIDLIHTVFRPTPTTPVAGAAAVVATTAPRAAAPGIERHLAETYGCRVTGVTHSLSDRTRLTVELAAMPEESDLLLCEIKAAGIDVAARWARERGMKVAFLDNTPVGIGGADPAEAVVAAAGTAVARYERTR